MTKTMQQTFTVTVLAAALFAVYGPALAEGPESSVSVGIGNWSNDRHQSGIFDGMRDGGGYLLLDADILKRDDATGTWLGLKLRNLGLDNREIKGVWERQGDIGASVEYSRIPRDNQWTFNTGLLGIGKTTQTVVTIAPGTGRDVELGTVRDRYTVKFFKNLGDGFKFNVSFRNEDKDGTRLWSRGGQPEFAVEPIDSTTRQLEAILTYSRDRLQLSAGYYGTSYNNAHSMVVTTGTASGSTTPATLNVTLPLDNRSHEFFVNGGYNFTPTTRGTFKASYSKATQNEFLPTAAAGLTWCGTCTPDALSPDHLKGRLDTTLLEAGLTAKPMPNLSLVANLRYRKFEDKTPIQGVVFSGSTPTVFNTPWSYKNNVGKLEATYRLPQSYSLLGGIEYNAQDRWVPSRGTLYVPFRAKLDETTYRVQLKKSMSETVNGSIAFAHSNRDGGRYTLPGDTYEDVINPLNIADRKRDKWRGMLDWSPTDRVNLQFAIEDSRDKYSGLPFGIQSGRGSVYSVDGSFQLSADWTINAWYSRDHNRAKERTQREDCVGAGQCRGTLQDLAELIKDNDLSEIGTSFGIGVRGTAIGKLKIGGDLEQFRSVNRYRQDLTLLSAGSGLPVEQAGAVTLVPPPDITNKMLRLKLFAQYPIQKNADLRFNLIYERWRTDDWSWTMFPVGGGTTPWAMMQTTDGTTTTAKPKQTSTFAGVRYIYRFE